MRDKRIVAEHRGGELSVENHRKLMKWAIFCFERVLPYYGKDLDEPLLDAIEVARDWKDGKCSTGDAIQASRTVHSFTKKINNKVAVMVVRAIGHGVGTAHMADHCMGAALYAQMVLKLSGVSFKEEKAIQIRELRNLPKNLYNYIIKTMEIKAKGLGL